MPPRRPYIRKTAYLQSKLACLEEKVIRQKHELHERNLMLLEMKAQIEAANQSSEAARTEVQAAPAGVPLVVKGSLWRRVLHLSRNKLPKDLI